MNALLTWKEIRGSEESKLMSSVLSCKNEHAWFITISECACSQGSSASESKSSYVLACACLNVPELARYSHHDKSTVLFLMDSKLRKH